MNDVIHTIKAMTSFSPLRGTKIDTNKHRTLKSARNLNVPKNPTATPAARMKTAAGMNPVS
jgi:hypothetical protein